MIYFLIGFSALFFLLPFIITRKTAVYLLSGYNSLSKEQQEQVDLEGYLKYMKKFMWFLAGSLLFIGLLLHFVTTSLVSGIFIMFYPLLALCVFVFKSGRYFKNVSNYNSKIAGYVLLLVVFCVGYLLYSDLQPNHITIQENGLEITGSYGEEIPFHTISRVQLLYQYPEIEFKRNGSAIGTMAKGYFEVNGGEEVKLILQDTLVPILRIDRVGEVSIFYNGTTEDAVDSVFKELQLKMKNIAVGAAQ